MIFSINFLVLSVLEISISVKKKDTLPSPPPLLHNSLMVHVVVWAASMKTQTLNGCFGLCKAVNEAHNTEEGTLQFAPQTLQVSTFFFFFWTYLVLLLSQLSKGKQTIQHFHILIFYIYSLNLLPSCWSVNSSYVFWRQTQHDPVMLRSSCPLKGLGINCMSLKNVQLQIDNTIWYTSTKSFSICQSIQEQLNKSRTSCTCWES